MLVLLKEKDAEAEDGINAGGPDVVEDAEDHV